MLKIFRAVLVFFESIERLQKFLKSNEFKRSRIRDRVRIMTEETATSEKENIVRQAVTSNSVTLMTRVFGRGTDFICYDEKLIASGGIHVIQTFLSEEYSEEIQIKGRTARQGNRGSYSMILLESELEKFGLDHNDVEQMISSQSIYKTLHDKRMLFAESKFPESMRYVAEIKKDHYRSQEFINNLKNRKLKEIIRFLVEQNYTPYSEQGKSRTICLMDATGSMTHLLEKSKNSVQDMFGRACTVLKANGFSEDSFELQFAVYRNYNCDKDSILQYSPWESSPQNLRTFMSSIQPKGGIRNEAIEIGFAHVNEQSDMTPVSQVILIGDVPPNTREEVVYNRTNNYGDEYWNSTKYKNVKYYEDELKTMIDKGIIVNTFYVRPPASVVFASIARKAGGICESLDIHSERGAEMLTGVVTE